MKSARLISPVKVRVNFPNVGRGLRHGSAVTYHDCTFKSQSRCVGLLSYLLIIVCTALSRIYLAHYINT